MKTFSTECTGLTIDDRGFIVSLSVCSNEILVKESPVLMVWRNSKMLLPEGASFSDDALTLAFDGADAEIEIKEDRSCITFEIKRISECTAAVFGTVDVNLGETVGEIVGVSRGRGLAFGMQALNAKTIPSLPVDFGSLSDYSSNITVGACLPVCVPTEEGSRFAFHCRRRDREEYLRVFEVEKSLVVPLDKNDPDAYIEGAKVALFGCEEKDALDRIGEIELEEGLFHPLIDGEWNKTSRKAMRSYLITDFEKEDYEHVTRTAKTAGINRINHGGPYETWGHFRFFENVFPDGDTDAAEFAKKANEENIITGTHTLTNFMSTNDPYVEKCDPHILKMRALVLAENIDDKQTVITVKHDQCFEQTLTLNALEIEDELITYESAEEKDGAVILTGCTRGAYETPASSHDMSKPLWRLWDYPYRTLFPDIILQDKFCDRLVSLYNETGIRNISFDGLEGCSYTGHTEYASVRFVERCHRGWAEKNQNFANDSVISDASNLNHFAWHMHTYMNWGEPWGESMRSGQIEGRIRNQEFFRRNLFPRMFGWILVRLADRKFEATTPEEIEWAMSMAAGFDAGYCIFANVKTLSKHGMLDTILQSIKLWDELRLNDMFTEEQKKRLLEVSSEWHLERVGSENRLYPLCVTKPYICNLSEMQPGQPGGSDWNVENRLNGDFGFRLRVEGDGKIDKPAFVIGGKTLKFNCSVYDGQYLIYNLPGAEAKAVLTDKNFNTLEEVSFTGSLQMAESATAVSFSCGHDRFDTPEISVRFIIKGEYEIIS